MILELKNNIMKTHIITEDQVDSNNNYIGSVDLSNFDGNLEAKVFIDHIKFKNIKVSGYIKFKGEAGIFSFGDIIAGGDIDSGRHIYAKGNINAGGKIYSFGSVNAIGNIDANGNIEAFSGEICAGGNINTGGNVKCPYLFSNDIVKVGGSIKVDKIHVIGDVEVGGSIEGYIDVTGNIKAKGIKSPSF